MAPRRCQCLQPACRGGTRMAPLLLLLASVAVAWSAGPAHAAYDTMSVPIRPPELPPLARQLLPPNGSAVLVMQAAYLNVSLDAANQLSFVTPRYLTPAVNRSALQSQALVLTAYCNDFTIELNNQLPFQSFHTCPASPANPSEEFVNGPKDFQWTNVHTHGLMIDPGAANVSNLCSPEFPDTAGFDNGTAPTLEEFYCSANATSDQVCQLLGDNIIVTGRPLSGTSSSGAGAQAVKYGVRQHPGTTLRYTYPLKSVAPGVHWYHPHEHGSVGIQTPTANGPLIVPESLLPGGVHSLYEPSSNATAGQCDSLLQLLSAMPLVDATFLQLSGLWFRNASDGVTPDDDSISFLGLSSSPKLASPLLYRTVGNVSRPQFSNAAGRDWLLVNGAFQPTINITANKYARWEFLNTLSMKWLDLTFQKVDNETGALSPAKCEFYLLGRDGVPLPSVPRALSSQPDPSVDAVSDLILGPANRADVLVRCDEPGTYVLASAAGPFHTNYTACGATHCECFGDAPANGATLRPANNLYGGRELRAAVVAVVAVAALPAGQRPDTDLGSGVCRSKLELFYYLNQKKFPEPAVRQCVSFMNSQNGGGCSVNNALFPQAVTYVQQGTQQLWSLRDITFHPFHLHGTQMRLSKLPPCVASVTNNWQVGDWADTILFPVCQNGCNWPNNGSGGGTCGSPVNVCDETEIQWLATNFADPVPAGATELCDTLRPGAYPRPPAGTCQQRVSVFHCHILPHEDEGCASLLVWYCPGDPEYAKAPPPRQTCPSAYPPCSEAPLHTKHVQAFVP